MNARWVKIAGTGLATQGESWAACDDDDEVIAQVGNSGPNTISYANICVPALPPAANYGYMGPQPSRQFLTISAAQKWCERQLANAYVFPAPQTGWATTVAPLGRP